MYQLNFHLRMATVFAKIKDVSLTFRFQMPATLDTKYTPRKTLSSSQSSIKLHENLSKYFLIMSNALTKFSTLGDCCKC